jgi:hypothetical protein
MLRSPRFILVLLAVLASTRALAEPTVAGRIIDYAAPASDYEVRRRADGNEQRVRVARFLELHLGDQIVVKRDDGWIDIDLGTGSPIHVRRRDSPYDVPAGMNRPPSSLGNLATYLRKLVVFPPTGGTLLVFPAWAGVVAGTKCLGQATRRASDPAREPVPRHRPRLVPWQRPRANA